MRHVYVDCAVQQNDDGACPHQVAELRCVEENRQPGGRAEKKQGDEQPHAQIEPEQGIRILSRAVLLADESAAESACGQGTRRSEKDGGEPHEPHFILAQQARQHHAVHQRDRLQGAFLQQHPPHAIGGLSGYSGHGLLGDYSERKLNEISIYRKFYWTEVCIIVWLQSQGYISECHRCLFGLYNNQCATYNDRQMKSNVHVTEAGGKRGMKLVLLLFLSALLSFFHLRVDMSAWSMDCVVRGNVWSMVSFSVVWMHTVVSIAFILLMAVRSRVVAYVILPIVLFFWVVPTYLLLTVGPCEYSELVTGILETNWHELSGLLSLPVVVMLLLLVVGSGMLGYILRRFFSCIQNVLRGWRCWGAVGYIVVSTAFVPLLAQYAPSAMIPLLFSYEQGETQKSSLHEDNRLAYMFNETSPVYVYRVLMPYYRQVAFVYYVFDYYYVKDVKKSEYLDSQLMVDEDVIVVLVIGESYRSDHASWNGYTRETLPQLTGIKRNIVNFPWVKSYATSTVSSIYGILSDATCRNREAAHTSFLGVTRKHGFNNNLMLCRTTQWERNPQINVVLDKQYSELVLCGDTEDLESHLGRIVDAGGRQMVVIEDGTGHVPYEHEPQFARFGNGMVDRYDNSLLQTDDVLFRLINKLKDKKAVLVYSSDHGQSFGEQGIYYHGGSLGVVKQRHVFSFVWYSDLYAAAHQDKVEGMRANAQKLLSHDDIYLSVLSLSGIRCDLPTPGCGDFTKPLPRPDVSEFSLADE